MTASIENNSVNGNAFVLCPVADPGLSASGAVFSLVTVVLGLVSYILSLEKNSNNSNQGGIAMAQPQLASASLYQGATPRGQPLSLLSLIQNTIAFAVWEKILIVL